MGFAKGFDDKIFLVGDFHGKITESDSLGRCVAIAHARGRTHDFPIVENGFAAMQRGKTVDGERAESARETSGLDLCQRLTANEITLVQGDTESKACFIRI